MSIVLKIKISVFSGTQFQVERYGNESCYENFLIVNDRFTLLNAELSTEQPVKCLKRLMLPPQTERLEIKQVISSICIAY
jgi:hypothetical protein